MTKRNDNRMSWIRNIEKLRASDTSSYYVEYEIASETNIPGLLDYESGAIQCHCMTLEKDKKGLYKYALKVKIASLEATDFNPRTATKNGYLFKDGIAGELLALFSLYFQCRFYMMSAFSGIPQSYKIKVEYAPIYRPPQPHFEPENFPGGKRNFTNGLSDFLSQVAQVDVLYHQGLILACYHYARALKEFGVDEEMVFIRLVSSVEAVSKWVELRKTDDLFNGKEFDEIVRTDVLSKNQRSELKKIFDVRKARVRFKRFVEQYSKGFFRGGNYKAPHTRIKKATLPKTLNAIYDSRSEYLHCGEPMYLSRPMRNSQKWDTDPSFGMIIGNRNFPTSRKLPYGSFFQRLVRHCLFAFIKDCSQQGD